MQNENPIIDVRYENSNNKELITKDEAKIENKIDNKVKTKEKIEEKKLLSDLNNEEIEFLPNYIEILEKPPSRVGRYTAIIIISICLAALVWSILGKVDIVSSSTGTIIVTGRSQTIKPVINGALKAIYVKEGNIVKKDDLLFTIDDDIVSSELTRIRNQINYETLAILKIKVILSQNINDYKANPNIPKNMFEEIFQQTKNELLKIRNSEKVYIQKIKKAKAEKLAMKQNLYDNTQLIKIIDDKISRANLSSKNGGYTIMALLDIKQQRLEKLKELNTYRNNIIILEENKVLMENEFEEFKTNIKKAAYDSLLEINKRIVNLKKSLAENIKNKSFHKIRSPIDGVVQQIKFNTIGSMLQQGQEMLVIVPKNQLLEAEINILSKDIGFVKAKQPVSIKIDSFPYTKYGTIDGVVRIISKDSIKDEKMGIIFPVRIALNKSYINTGTSKTDLSAGMSVTVDIKTGSRRVIEYLLSPIQEYASESLGER